MRTEDLIETGTFLHQEHREWLNQLNFYQDEIKFFQNELVIVMHRHLDSYSIVEHADEYKELLRKKLQHIDELRHQIILHEKRLAEIPGPQKSTSNGHSMVRENFFRFVTDFELLKKNFKRFIAHND